MLGYAGTQVVLTSPLFPLREITVLGDLAHTSRDELEGATRGRVAGNFFAADLGAIRGGLEQLAWVRRADLRRVCAGPDRSGSRGARGAGALGRRRLVNTFGERSPGRPRQRCRCSRAGAHRRRGDAPLPPLRRDGAAAGRDARARDPHAALRLAAAPLGRAQHRAGPRPRERPRPRRASRASWPPIRRRSGASRAATSTSICATRTASPCA